MEQCWFVVVQSLLLDLFWIKEVHASDEDLHPTRARSFKGSSTLPPRPHQSYQICTDQPYYFLVSKVTFHGIAATSSARHYSISSFLFPSSLFLFQAF
jgi:hypothetical protein